MRKPPLTQSRIFAALAIAFIADALQFPVTGITATGVLAIPGEATDFLIDCIVMAATIRILGFHWILLPSLFVELIPGLDLVPTWTACVAAVVYLRKREWPPIKSRLPVTIEVDPTDKKEKLVAHTPPLLPRPTGKDAIDV